MEDNSIKFFEMLESQGWKYGKVAKENIINALPDSLDLTRFARRLINQHRSKPVPDTLIKEAKKQARYEKDDVQCDKCRGGQISVYQHAEWWYDKASQEYLSLNGWSIEKLDNLIFIPKASVNCYCVNPKFHSPNIRNYLKWLNSWAICAPRAYELAYIQLWLFYDNCLDGNMGFDNFSPFNYWGASIDNQQDLRIIDILNDKVKTMVLELMENKPKKQKETKFKQIEEVIY